MAYRVELAGRAEKELDALERRDRARVVAALLRLSEAPKTGANVKALTGGGYRLRVGDFRVLYRVEDDVLLVLVVKVGHRREVYRGL